MRTITFMMYIIGSLGYELTCPRRLANRIIGGQDAKIGEVPYQLSLFDLNDFICGASIIGSNWAITAAHCVTQQKDRKLRENLRVGAGNEVRSQGSFYNVLKIIRHSSYSEKSFENDIALLEIDGNFLFTEKVKAVKLPNSEAKPGLSAIISGWGSTEAHRSRSNYPDTLKKATVTILDRKLCKKAYRKVRPVSVAMICAGTEKGGKDACQNDSGGPLVVGNILYGIVSWGCGCGRANYPGVYTNVAEYTSWIKKKTNT